MSQITRALLPMSAALLAACHAAPMASQLTSLPGAAFRSLATSGTWTMESGPLLTATTSTSTIRLPTSSGYDYRTFFAGIDTRVSTDGLSWTSSATTGIVNNGGDFVCNPSVVRIGSGQYVMIYERDTGSGASMVRRLHRATCNTPNPSSFTPTPGSGTDGAVMEAEADENNFLSVPEVFMDPAGSSTMYMYFVAKGDHTELASSTDYGMTWTRLGDVTISGMWPDGVVVDPELVVTPSGQYKFFFAAGPTGTTDPMATKSIYSASGTSLTAFTMDSTPCVASSSGDDLVDPDIVFKKGGGGYRMYFGATNSSTGTYDLMSATATSL